MQVRETVPLSTMRSAASTFQMGDVLYGRLRPYLNKVCVPSFEGACSSEFLVLKPCKNLLPEYLGYYLHSQYFVYFASHTVTGDRPRIDFDQIAQFLIPVPPAAVQCRIVNRVREISEEIDDGERALAEARAGFDTYRNSLLNAAVTGQLTSDWRKDRNPKQSGQQSLNRIINRRHSRDTRSTAESVVEDNLPSLPASWIWCRNDVAGRVQLGRQRTPKDHNGPHMRPYLRVANVYEDRIDLTDVKRMNFTPPEFETFRLSNGDILLNEGQSLELVGRPAMFRREIEGCCFQNTLVRFQAEDEVDPEYALIAFLSAMHTKRFQRIAKITTNIAHLGAGRFGELGFPLAPPDEQREIVRRYRSRMLQLEEVRTSHLPKTGSLRQSILSAAFRGELL